MKVLLINGSPNPEGCTYTALSTVAAALNAEGIETEIFQIGDEPIRGCIGCGGCKAGRCVFDDDPVNEALAKMEAADGLVVGTPVYYAAPNGALLAFLDRMFYAGQCFAYKPGACVATARRAGTTASLDVLNKYFTISHMPIVSSQYWNMLFRNNPGVAGSDEEGLQTMEYLGRNMAWLLKSIEAGKAAGIAPPPAETRKWTHFMK